MAIADRTPGDTRPTPPPAYQSAPMQAAPAPAAPAAPTTPQDPRQAAYDATVSGTPAPPISLGADPAYNAFLANLGLTHANLVDAAALKAANERAALGPALAQNTQNTQDQLSRAALNANNRGIYNSAEKGLTGAAILGAGLSRQDILQNNLAQSLAALYNQLGMNVGQAEAKAAPQAQAAAGRQAETAALNGPNPFLALMNARGASGGGPTG